MLRELTLQKPGRLIQLEEIFNSITHGIGSALAATALVLLAVKSADGPAGGIVAVVVFGSGLVILYLASTLYHSFATTKHSSFFNMLDHCAIYILIAATYTPFALLVLPTATGWVLFGLIWGLAIIGILKKVFWGMRFPRFSLFFYLLMGWAAIPFAGILVENLNDTSLNFLLIGGLSYSLGTIFFALDYLPFFHVIWHIFVLAGSICHFFAIYLIC